MRYAVLADIHGNLPALEAVVAAAQSQGVDGFLVLGDIAARAPFPRETWQMVRELGCVCIRGNVDQYLLDYEDALRQGKPVDLGPRTALTRWTYAQLRSEDMAALRALPDQLSFSADGAAPVRLVHASPERIDRGIVPDENPQALAGFQRARLVKPGYIPLPLADCFLSVAEKNLACGHTYIPWVQRSDGRLAFNPGSVGVPSNGDPRAQYALLDWDGTEWRVELQAVEFDRARLKKAFETSGMLEAAAGFARAFMLNALVGENVAYFYILHGDALARARGFSGFNDLPDELWAEVDKTFPWEKYAY